MKIDSEAQRHQLVEALKLAEAPVVIQQQNSDGLIVVYGSANTDQEQTWHVDTAGRVNTVGVA